EIGGVVNSTLGEQLLRNRIDGVVVVSFERRLFPTPDRVNDGIFDPVLPEPSERGPTRRTPPSNGLLQQGQRAPSCVEGPTSCRVVPDRGRPHECLFLVREGRP